MTSIYNSSVRIIKEICWRDFLEERSRLYSLIPFDIGTPYVENITSYMIRLANVHNVGICKLMDYEINPLVSNPLRVSKTGAFSQANELMGGNEFSLKIVDALVDLTAVSDIKYTTINLINGVLNIVNLFRGFQAWCPCCYRESLEEKGHVYNQLIWNFDDVNICLKHKVKLRVVCQVCNKSNPFLHKKIQLGLCMYCKSKLYEQQVSEDNVEDWEVWVAYCMGDLLAHMPRIKVPSLKNIDFIVHRVLNEIFMGSYRTMCEYFNVSKFTITPLKVRDVPPPLTFLLKISYLTKQTLIELLCDQKIPFINRDTKEEIKIKKDIYENVDVDYAENYLQQVLRTEGIISILDVCVKLNISQSTLRNGFSEYYENISLHNYSLYKERFERRLKEKLN
ncbi:TniQ family protein [Bacillus sp. WLY-B-L8]|uniref:TniQ family protein n=1 Tax=Bacillus multifaciens TaxID=3068506 RepID=UPI0027427E2F|nr:TniQ family protein [Bacillus sp. WLY-B-L8]MDP7979711.1 TniQ family protein [Bacillus sp. WLY-B-L8]